MYKILIISALVFSGCSYFTFNKTMCDEIASDPHNTLPQECMQYSEEEAEKAFNKTDKKPDDISEIVEFNKILEKNSTSQSIDDGSIEFKKE